MNAPLAFIREIDSTIAQCSRERRAVMIRHLTDLFLVNSNQYSDDEIALIDDVFIRLVAAIEGSSRALLALRLGPISNAPPKTVRTLGCDDSIEVASPILIRSERLDDATLIECAKTKSQEHLLAISRRKTLSAALTDILVVRGDQQVVLSTVQNSGARFSNDGFAILVKRSNGDDLLAKCVGTRPDIPPYLFQRLLETASETVRTKLMTENPAARRDIDGVITDVTGRIRTQATIQPPEYAAAQVLVESLNLSGQLNAARLEAFANDGHFEQTVVALALMADMPTDAVERKMNEAHAEFLLILAKAIGLSWPTTKTIVALGNGKIPRSANEIDECEKAFQRLNRLTAQQIIGFHRTRERAAAKQRMQ
jgi:uncharacterized protein (DUF2336 family)